MNDFLSNLYGMDEEIHGQQQQQDPGAYGEEARDLQRIVAILDAAMEIVASVPTHPPPRVETPKQSKIAGSKDGRSSQ